jgi:hypothetical protein
LDTSSVETLYASSFAYHVDSTEFLWREYVFASLGHRCPILRPWHKQLRPLQVTGISHIICLGCTKPLASED